jgi:glycosyltransferase involved in cell wall biosynthesis
MKKLPTLSIVIPVYNEMESIAETVRRVQILRNNLAKEVDVELIFVNDGSKDSSLEILRNLSEYNNYIKIISLSRNFGHQIAVTAGIDYSIGDYVAVIDADLQDPPELIIDMYRLALTGFEVVYGKRRARAGESVFKKVTAAAFYRLLNYLCETDIPPDTGDFRLMSRRVVNALKRCREQHRFIRGLVPWIGYRSASLEYDRSERFAGKTKYPFKKMLEFAATAILSFSTKPLTIAIRIGLTTILLGILGAVYMLYLKLFTNIPVPGLTAILLSIVFFSGVQILLIGIVGEYIGRIFEQVKGRPLYLVDETVNLISTPELID